MKDVCNVSGLTELEWMRVPHNDLRPDRELAILEPPPTSRSQAALHNTSGGVRKTIGGQMTMLKRSSKIACFKGEQ